MKKRLEKFFFFGLLLCSRESRCAEKEDKVGTYLPLVIFQFRNLKP